MMSSCYYILVLCLRVLVVGGPTLDIVVVDRERTVRYGGPGIYVSAAASVLGLDLEVYVLGVVGWRTLGSLRVIGELGGLWIGTYFPWVEGLVFEHVYRGVNRVSSMIGTATALPSSTIFNAIEKIRPDIVVLSPVYGEVTIGTPSLLYHNYDECIFFDIQGLQRRGLARGLPPIVSSFIHASDKEAEDIYNIVKSHILETSGYGPIRLVHENSVEVIGHAVGELNDPTGAGDVFTFLFAYRFCRDYSVVESVEWASRITYNVLPTINDLVKNLSSDSHSLGDG